MSEYGSYHITVKVILVYKNKFLIVKRSNRTGKKIQSLWELPGGGVNIGEDPQNALIREVKEEIGITLNSLKPVLVWHMKRDEGEIIGITYLCYVDDNKLSLSEEHVDYAWIKTDEIKNYDLIGNLQNDLNKIFSDIII